MIKSKLILFCLLFITWQATAQNEFITTWQTTTANESITIPTNPSYTYSYNVDWGDGTIQVGLTGNTIHTYTTAGTYTVEITGIFPAIYFNNTGDRSKIMSIEQWGDNEWSDMSNAFHGCFKMEYNATDVPDLSKVTSLASTFAIANAFNGDISSWDVSNITNMGYTFNGALSFNQDIGNWDVSNVRNMDFMFLGARDFNQNLDAWNVSNVVSMPWMFGNANLSTENYDSILIGWSKLPLQNNVVFQGGETYCKGQSARQSIINNF